jgi:hypothetical protein
VEPLAGLIDQLHQLGRLTDTDLDPVGVVILELIARLTTAVPSFVGLTVTMPGSTGPTLTAAPPPGRRVSTSLRFSLTRPDARSTRFTLYAHQPGALVDLDADLTHLGRHPDRHDQRTLTVTDIHLDHDLPAPILVTGLTGLDDQAVLHRAEGVLIERGATPDEAALQLRENATVAGLDPLPYARQVLTDCTTTDP